MSWFEKLQNLDRRYIYIVVALCIIIPFTFTFHTNTYTTEPVENIYQLIDSYAGREDRAILLSIEHDPSTSPELQPMEIAIVRHCFERGVKVFFLTFRITASPIIDYVINTTKEEFADIQSGVDYVNFGYKPAALYLPIILGMGDDIAEAVETDSEGRKLNNLEIMKGIKNYNEMNLVVEFSGSSYGFGWITYARSRFGANVAAGITAVMAADTYPYIQSGQLVGVLGGLKGAAEYEKLVDLFAVNQLEFSKEQEKQTFPRINNDDILYKFKTARIGMNAQNVAHVMIIVFILIGNIGYFLERRRKNKQGEGS
ncbi:MAG: hypothetical protein K8S56_10390 [Candidatus Cloacimonetes bacterium]|nr:hypothetical protein [Candidatus Cloacimonadota bacterium]